MDTLHDAYATLIVNLRDRESVLLTPEACTFERRNVVRSHSEIMHALRRYDLTSPDVQVMAQRHESDHIVLIVQQRRPLPELLAAAGLEILMSSQLPHE
jgi:hypothetical protein